MRFLYLILSLTIIATVAAGQMNSECPCPENYDPVCYGTIKYANKCLASCAGVSDDLLTKCTNNNDNDEPAPCSCPKNYDPVCYNAKRYDNKCLALCAGAAETELESCDSSINNPTPPIPDDGQDNGEVKVNNCATVDCPHPPVPSCRPDEKLFAMPLNACCRVPVCDFFPDNVVFRDPRTPPTKSCYDYRNQRVVYSGQNFYVGCDFCVCEDGKTNCVSGSCYATTDCRNPKNKCDAGSRCVAQNVQCARAPCKPEFACVPESAFNSTDCYASPFICNDFMSTCALSRQCVVGVNGRETCTKVGTCQHSTNDFSTPNPMCKGQNCAVLRVGIDNSDNKFDLTSSYSFNSVSSIKTCSLLQDFFLRYDNRDSVTFSCNTYINRAGSMENRFYDEYEKKVVLSSFIVIAVESTEHSISAVEVIKKMKEMFSSGTLQVYYPETLGYLTTEADIMTHPKKDPHGDKSSSIWSKVALYAGLGSLALFVIGFVAFIIAHCYYKREARIAAAAAAAAAAAGGDKCSIHNDSNNENHWKKSPSPPPYDDYDSHNDNVALTKAYLAGAESTNSFVPTPFSVNFSNDNSNDNGDKKGGDYKPLESVVFKMDETPKSETDL